MSDTLDIWLIGIGTGSPAHVTAEGMQALRDVSVVLVPERVQARTTLPRCAATS